MTSSSPSTDIKAMAPTNRRLLSIAVVVMVLSAAVAAVYILTAEDTVVIAIMMPGDAEFSHLNETLSAIQMAVEELNEYGGINDQRIKMVSETPLSGVDDPEEVFREMERKYDPLFFVVGSCGLLASVSSAADEIGVPVIGISSAPGLTEGHPWVFRYYTSAEEEANSAFEIFEMLEAETLGAIHTDDPHGCGVTDMLSEMVTEAGGVYESEIWSSDTTLQEQLVANLTHNDAIYVVGPCASTMMMLREVKASGYSGHIIASSCLSTPMTWPLPELEDVYVSSPLLYKEENILAASFSEKFEARYGLPLTHHAAAGYDILMLVHGVLEGSETSRDSLKNELVAGFVFTGVLGNTMASPGTHDFTFPVFPSHISGGELWYL